MLMKRWGALLVLLLLALPARAQQLNNGGGGSGSATAVFPPGPVSITGNTGNGTDQISAVNVNGILHSKAFGASGSAAYCTNAGAITQGTTSLTLGTCTPSNDFQNGQGISISGAGPADSVNGTPLSSITPPAPTLTVNPATPNSNYPATTTCSYEIAVIGPNGGISKVGPPTTVTNCSANLIPYGSAGSNNYINPIDNVALQWAPVGPTTVTSASYAFPTSTINVSSTTGFNMPGDIWIYDLQQKVHCTGSTATSFTGCTGGLGDALSGVQVEAVAGYAVYRQLGGSGSYYLLRMFPYAPTGSGIFMYDFGPTAVWSTTPANMVAAPSVPNTAPSTATNTTLVTTVQSGGGTSTLTLAQPASSTVSGANVTHDDTAPLKAMLTKACAQYSDSRYSSGGSVYLDPGTYSISGELGWNANTCGHLLMDGAGPASNLRPTGLNRAVHIYSPAYPGPDFKHELRNFRIEDMTGAPEPMITCNDLPNVHMHDIKVFGAYSFFSGLQIAGCEQSHFDSMYIEHGGNWIELNYGSDGQGGPNSNEINAMNLDLAVNVGIWSNGPGDMSFHSNSLVFAPTIVDEHSVGQANGKRVWSDNHFEMFNVGFLMEAGVDTIQHNVWFGDALYRGLCIDQIGGDLDTISDNEFIASGGVTITSGAANVNFSGNQMYNMQLNSTDSKRCGSNNVNIGGAAPVPDIACSTNASQVNSVNLSKSVPGRDILTGNNFSLTTGQVFNVIASGNNMVLDLIGAYGGVGNHCRFYLPGGGNAVKELDAGGSAPGGLCGVVPSAATCGAASNAACTWNVYISSGAWYVQYMGAGTGGASYFLEAY